MCVNADGTRCDHAATSRTPPARQSRPSPPTPHCRSSCSASRAPNSAPRAPVYTLLGSQRAICCQCWPRRTVGETTCTLDPGRNQSPSRGVASGVGKRPNVHLVQVSFGFAFVCRLCLANLLVVHCITGYRLPVNFPTCNLGRPETAGRVAGPFRDEGR